MKHPSPSRIRVWSFRLFVASVACIPIAAGVLALGLMMSGGGHGGYGMWYFGLFLALVCWLLAVAGFVTAMVTWLRERRTVWWAIPAGVIVLAITAHWLWIR